MLACLSNDDESHAQQDLASITRSALSRLEQAGSADHADAHQAEGYADVVAPVQAALQERHSKDGREQDLSTSQHLVH